MKNKRWPENNETANFHDIVSPIRKAIEFAYELRRINKQKNIPWGGFDIGEMEKITCFSPSDNLRYKHLKYSLEEQGRDALDEILGICIRLGIEQGRRKTIRKFKEQEVKHDSTRTHKKIHPK